MARADTSTAILDATLGLLQSGRERVTYEVVARHAGVARQTLYSHFPTRAELLVATVDHAGRSAGLDEARQPVLDAPTGRAALRALAHLHVSFVPRFLGAQVAVERERSVDPGVEDAFRRRSASRRQLAQLVATRLRAEGDLASPWTVESARDLIATLYSGTSTAQFLWDLGWTEAEMHERLLVVLERTLLKTTTEEER